MRNMRPHEPHHRNLPKMLAEMPITKCLLMQEMNQGSNELSYNHCQWYQILMTQKFHNCC